VDSRSQIAMPSMTATNVATIDTNILIYSVDPTDPVKHRIANYVFYETVGKGSSIPLQCLTEFYSASTRKQILTVADATDVITTVLRAADAVAANSADLTAAMALHKADHIQFFDALLLTTVARAGFTILFSEDFQHNRSYGTVTVCNPFLMQPDELELALRSS
jgi:predicted nucleic acid-binding protein